MPPPSDNISPDAETFIKVTEIWGLDESGGSLVLQSGIYGRHGRFREAAERARFGWGEGLPGRAWAELRPVIMRDLASGGFKRTEAARADGLTCGVALPIFPGDGRVAVVVFFCGGQDRESGAIEVWSRSQHSPEMLVLQEGYYGSLSGFEETSRSVRFRQGDGLPGVVWEVSRPCIMADIGGSGPFYRAQAARNAQLSTALGIPCSFGGEDLSVLVLLSAKPLPIARRYEIWAPTADGKTLRLAFVVNNGEPGTPDASLRVRRDEGTVGRVWATGFPLALEDAPDAGGFRVVALPTFVGDAVSSVVVWYF